MTHNNKHSTAYYKFSHDDDDDDDSSRSRSVLNGQRITDRETAPSLNQQTTHTRTSTFGQSWSTSIRRIYRTILNVRIHGRWSLCADIRYTRVVYSVNVCTEQLCIPPH